MGLRDEQYGALVQCYIKLDNVWRLSSALGCSLKWISNDNDCNLTGSNSSLWQSCHPYDCVECEPKNFEHLIWMHFIWTDNSIKFQIVGWPE